MATWNNSQCMALEEKGMALRFLAAWRRRHAKSVMGETLCTIKHTVNVTVKGLESSARPFSVTNVRDRTNQGK